MALFLFVAILFSSHTARAQRTETTSLPSPRSVLGFNPGDDRTIADWKQISDYFTRLDRASDRVQLQNIGTSTLGRPMFVTFISAPENIRNLEKYKDIQRQLADPRLVPKNGDVNFTETLVREGKTVVVISCSIHSTEIVASQMSMQLAYELASASDTDTLSILRNTILILIPSPNPDGIDIVANWYRKTLGTPQEGTAPPELYHHYAGHDDNRDWFMMNLKETKAVTRLLWKEWFPQIVYDVHQQGSNGSRFFVPPFYDPPNPHISPLLLRQVGLVGHKMAADVTAAGFKGILTNALYDTWWHGGFRTAPYYHNSIGILTEAASARLMSPANVTREQLSRAGTRGMRSALEVSTSFPNPWPGGAWHPRDIMQIEMIASRSVLSLAANYRAEYLRNFHGLGKENLARPAAGEPLAYIIWPGQGRDENTAKLVGALIEQGIEVHRLEKELYGRHGDHAIKRLAPVTVGNRTVTPLGLSLVSDQTIHEMPAGSYLVYLDQPYRRNVLALFEPQVYPDRVTPTGEAERPYDVAGWTLPMMMGLQASAVLEIREPPSERKLTLIKSENDVRRDLALPLWTTGDKSPIANPVKPGIRIGIYKNSRAGNMDEGWTRYVFDSFNVPFQSLSESAINSENARAKVDVIVLPSEQTRQTAEPDADAQSARGINDAGYTNLARFVEDGGTLICFDGSCGQLIRRWSLPLKNALEGLRSSEFYCPGSILRLNVDIRHSVARTMLEDTDAFFVNSSAFEIIEPRGTAANSAAPNLAVQVVARYAKEEVLRSGWLLGEDKIKDKIALAEVPMGKGRIILFAFRPQHRGQTWGTFPFIWNAINAAR